MWQRTKYRGFSTEYHSSTTILMHSLIMATKLVSLAFCISRDQEHCTNVLLLSYSQELGTWYQCIIVVIFPGTRNMVLMYYCCHISGARMMVPMYYHCHIPKNQEHCTNVLLMSCIIYMHYIYRSHKCDCGHMSAVFISKYRIHWKQ